MTTRRLSGASSAGSNGMGPMIEAYDAFKKKHMQQNKEIIHKNSVLSKSNSELERTVTSLRAERLALKGSLFHLECENSNLRTRLQQTESQLNEAREAASAGTSPWDHEQLQMTQRLYVNALAALQALGAGLPTCSSPMSDEASDVPSSPPPIPNSTILHPRLSTVTASSSSSSSGDLNRNVTVSRRGSNVERAPRPSSIILQRNPDLSHISEGGEQSHFNDDEEDDSGDEAPMQSAWKGTVLDGSVRRRISDLHLKPRALASPSVTRPPTPIFVTPPTSSPLSTPLATLSETTTTTSSAQLSASTSAPTARPVPSKARSMNSAPPAARSAHANTSSFSQQKPARRVSGIVKAPTPQPQPGQLGSVRSDSAAGVAATSTTTGPSGKRTSIVGQLGRKSVWMSTSTATASSASSNGGKKSNEEDDYWNERKTLLKLESLGPKEMLAVVGSRRRTSTLAASGPKTSASSAPDKDTSTASSALASASEDEDRVGESISTQLVKHQKRYEDEESSNEVNDQSSDEEFVPSKKLVEAAMAKARGKRRATRAGSQEVEQEQEQEYDYEQDSNFGSALMSSASQPAAHRGMPSSSAPSVLQSNMMLANGGNEEGDAGGRRARKSVNYALPKLNTKMRRPEDYVPVINTHPRKSHRPSVASASGAPSNILRTKSSLTSLRGRASMANSENEAMSDLDEEDSLPSRNEKDGPLKGSTGGAVNARRHTLMA
ncbi:BQ2448_2122 [Microbotryum intermedium]|uniref:BQ2448_2122 protein n=1 Tax=Microbotryum intermedium TaxID=269621 RepID=A0A238F5B1_9BASI|nr:BQ2448_2122 [Microbotryum intermedium]